MIPPKMQQVLDGVREIERHGGYIVTPAGTHKLSKLADTLQSALEEMQQERQTWQPIETAPKDGTVVDIWVVNEEGDGWRESNAYFVMNVGDTVVDKLTTGKFPTWTKRHIKRDGWFAPNHDYDGADGWCDEPRWYNSHPLQNRWVSITATHWMPLPLPPESGKENFNG